MACIPGGLGVAKGEVLADRPRNAADAGWAFTPLAQADVPAATTAPTTASAARRLAKGKRVPVLEASRCTG